MSTPEFLYLLAPLLLAFAAIFFLQHRHRLIDGCRENHLLRVLTSIDQPMEPMDPNPTKAPISPDSGDMTPIQSNAREQAVGGENPHGERRSPLPSGGSR